MTVVDMNRLVKGKIANPVLQDRDIVFVPEFRSRIGPVRSFPRSRRWPAPCSTCADKDTPMSDIYVFGRPQVAAALQADMGMPEEKISLSDLLHVVRKRKATILGWPPAPLHLRPRPRCCRRRSIRPGRA